MTPDERTAAIRERSQAIPDRKDRRWVRGAFKNFDIWRTPVDYLVLNADNRRFRAEKLKWEEELGRALDPQASEVDERSVISILLDDNHRVADDEIVGKTSKDALSLAKDWATRGQEQPLWIRPDGYVINGNRRLAALKRLAATEGSATGSYRYVEVIFLEWAEIDESELFEMEAREQLTEGYKVRYGDLNTLLTLREAAVRAQIDWTDSVSIERVAKTIQDLVGGNASYAGVQLRAIRYMDEYLEYTEEPGRYQRMLGQVERFRDIGKNMQIAEKESPSDALDLLVLQFQAVQAGVGHMDMRELRKIMIEDPTRFSRLVSEVQELVEQPPAGPVEQEDPATIDPDSGDDEEDGDAPPPPSASFPQKSVKRALDIAVEARRARQKNDAEQALRTAAERLSQVSPEQMRALLVGAKTPVIDALARIRQWVDSVSHVDEP
jgi:hypothetical protein